MKETFVIKNELGLHARAAAKFVEITNAFDSEIIVTVGNSTFDGKSIMGLLSIGIKKGEEIIVSISGRDEEDAFKAIDKLINEDLLEME
ncbi:MAG: HPr family phosphocarrier protein [Bacillota bacterium]|nr:HPr family phosphocarrier protein [Bacillota bacterium]